MNWPGPDGSDYFLGRHPQVYDPAEDTFLLATAVHLEVRPGERFLEVGCGSGLAAMVAARRGAESFATDLNPFAVLQARHNARENGVRVDVRESDLLGAVLDKAPFDVIAFNPPYLPTAPDEYLPGPINLAFDGGPDGNATVLRFAQQVAELRPLPRCILIVHSSLADPAPLATALDPLGYTCDVVAQESHFFERLMVRRFAQP